MSLRLRSEEFNETAFTHAADVGPLTRRSMLGILTPGAILLSVWSTRFRRMRL